MKFLYPQFLYALAFLAIPVLIHLFNFKRYKTVYFSNVRFLRELQEETSSRSRIKHWLVLLSRLLALAALVLAFAQPFIPEQEQSTASETGLVSIYLDNSFSMNALSEDMSLVEKARNIARDIVNSSGEGVQYMLLTNDFERRHQRVLNREEILAFIDEIESSPKVATMSEALGRQLGDQAVNPATTRFFHISDFQEYMVDLELDSAVNLHLLPVQTVEMRNVYVDSAWFYEPIQIIGQQNSLVIRLVNDGDQAVENSRLSIRINGKVKSVGEVNIPARAELLDTVVLTLTEAGWNTADIEISDYPVSFDDRFFLTYNVFASIPVQMISGGVPNQFLNVFYAGNEVFQAVSSPLSAIELSSIGKQRLIILESVERISSGLANELNGFVRKGGSLLIFPPATADLASYNSLLGQMNADRMGELREQERRVRKINREEKVFSDVFSRLPDNTRMPRTKAFFPLSASAANGRETLLEFDNQDDLLNKYSVGKGKLYLCTVPLDRELTDLPLHAVFAPMIYKIGILSTGRLSSPYVLQKNLAVTLEERFSQGGGALRISGASNEFIPGQRSVGGNIVLDLSEQLSEAGIYQVLNSDDLQLQSIAVNYDRVESALRFLDREALVERFGNSSVKVIEAVDNVAEAVEELDRGRSLWKLCIILALVFLAIEVLLIRLLPG